MTASEWRVVILFRFALCLCRCVSGREEYRRLSVALVGDMRFVCDYLLQHFRVAFQHKGLY